MSYLKNVLETRDFVLSDYLFSRGTKRPSIVAAYLVSPIDGGEAVMAAAINLRASDTELSLAG